MTAQAAIRVSYDVGCLTSLRKLPDRIGAKFMDMMIKFMSDPSAGGLNFETIKGAKDRGFKSLRLDQDHRAVAFQSGGDVMFLHVNKHDDAYDWANRRSIRVDASTNRIRIVEEVPTEQIEAIVSNTPNEGLFDKISDQRLIALGVIADELSRIRAIQSLEALESQKDDLDSTTFDVLVAIEAGYTDAEVAELIGVRGDHEPASSSAPDLSFSDIVTSPESRQRIFIPKDEDELRRFFEGDLEGWRVFLHPAQRRLAYRDYNGPVLIRGGAGTGKTVVAMHRAKYLADRFVELGKGGGDQRILVTTFTTSLAADIEGNLAKLCPEHILKGNPRIEVINLDRWVQNFLKRKNFDRSIVYFGAEGERLKEIWQEVIDDLGTPDGLSEEFIKAEWAQIVQAKGILAERDYLKAPRTGRGTPLDRKKRTQLWSLFEAYRARLLSEGLAEPDDAYREAIAILSAGPSSLPYVAVIVDEAQDMGEQALKLVRAIAPPTSSGDTNSLFIVGDAHQRIYARRASMKACGIDVVGRSRTLRINYRTSEEIRRWAVSALEGVTVDDLDQGTDSLAGYKSLFNGPAPEIHAFDTEVDELVGLADWAKVQIASGVRPSEIGILAASNDQLEAIGRKFKEAGIASHPLRANEKDDQAVDGVRLCTMHRAKGLEFRSVAIAYLSASRYPPSFVINQSVDEVDKREALNRYRSLLHVAATRAKQELRVSFTGQRSKLLPVQS